MGHTNETPQGTWWIARPENANKVFYALCTVCALLLFCDLIFLLYSRHGGSLGHLKGHFDFEDIPFFHGAYGFMAFVFVVLSGTKLRTVLMRPEGYYDIPYTPREDDHGHDQHGHEQHGHDEHGHDDHGQDQHGQHGQEESTSSDDTSSLEQSPVAEEAESEAPKQDENDISAGSAENDASSEGGDEL